MYLKYFKRLFDVILSLVLILFFSPLMVFIFFLVYVFIGFPIFVQKRPGLNNKIFNLYKFKSLYDAPKNIPENKRQNKVGNFLRKTGLDELPQLFNILENKMSFVGPRPLLIEYLIEYSRTERKRHLVKPGITGLAQVNPDPSGKKNWKKSIEYDLFYASNVSFFLDIKILAKTIKLIFLKKKQFDDFRKYYEK